MTNPSLAQGGCANVAAMSEHPETYAIPGCEWAAGFINGSDPVAGCAGALGVSVAKGEDEAWRPWIVCCAHYHDRAAYWARRGGFVPRGWVPLLADERRA